MNMLPTNHIGVPDEERRSGKLKVGDDFVRQNPAFQPPALMQEGGFGFGFDFDSSSPKLKSKARKKDAMEVYGSRIIRSTGRKDRHSKVCTARGTRDRRVRLSPKTAILFYDVQERLGYDRPSKAIDWLMEEAKAAIDALDEPPPPTSNVAELNANNQQMLKAESGINAVENSEQLNYGDYSISSFGHLTQAATTLYCSRSEEQFSPAPLTTSPEIFDPNAEIARLQRIFSCNYNSSLPPLNFPAAVDLGHANMFTDREPLQSRFSNPTLQFPVASFFHEELLNFTGPASFKENPSKASFLK